MDSFGKYKELLYGELKQYWKVAKELTNKSKVPWQRWQNLQKQSQKVQNVLAQDIEKLPQNSSLSILLQNFLKLFKTQHAFIQNYAALYLKENWIFLFNAQQKAFVPQHKEAYKNIVRQINVDDLEKLLKQNSMVLYAGDFWHKEYLKLFSFFKENQNVNPSPILQKKLLDLAPLGKDNWLTWEIKSSFLQLLYRQVFTEITPAKEKILKDFLKKLWQEEEPHKITDLLIKNSAQELWDNWTNHHAFYLSECLCDLESNPNIQKLLDSEFKNDIGCIHRSSFKVKNKKKSLQKNQKWTSKPHILIFWVVFLLAFINVLVYPLNEKKPLQKTFTKKSTKKAIAHKNSSQKIEKKKAIKKEITEIPMALPKKVFQKGRWTAKLKKRLEEQREKLAKITKSYQKSQKKQKKLSKALKNLQPKKEKAKKEKVKKERKKPALAKNEKKPKENLKIKDKKPKNNKKNRKKITKKVAFKIANLRFQEKKNAGLHGNFHQTPKLIAKIKGKQRYLGE